MLEIRYLCDRCHKEDARYTSMICKCGGDLRGYGFVISGTRDQFGIGKSFVDEKTGKVVDTWQKWERAGYKNPLETIKNHSVKEMVKEKREKLRGKRQRQLKEVLV